MAQYLINPRTSVIYEALARHGEQVWCRRIVDGVLETWHQQALETYTPTPVVGDVWVDDETGGDVVVVGTRDGFPVVIEVVDDTTPDVPAVATRRDPSQLTPRYGRAREPEPTKEVEEQQPLLVEQPVVTSKRHETA